MKHAIFLSMILGATALTGCHPASSPTPAIPSGMAVSKPLPVPENIDQREARIVASLRLSDRQMKIYRLVKAQERADNARLSRMWREGVAQIVIDTQLAKIQLRRTEGLRSAMTPAQYETYQREWAQPAR